MKKTILLVDVNFKAGHHLNYIVSIIKNRDFEYITLLNSDVKLVDQSYQFVNNENRIKEIILLHKAIQNIVKRFDVDIIHFLEGDYFLRFYGLELIGFGKKRIVITYHHVFESKIKILSYYTHLLFSSAVAVHTEYIKNRLKSKKVICIDYPHFVLCDESRDIAPKYERKPVLLSLGGTRYNKGLDILLKALQKVSCDYTLVIAGKEEDIKENEINVLTEKYSDKVYKILRFLSDQEMIDLIIQSDIIVLPYRNDFSGASGPMTDGIWFKKIIVGPNNKSIGDIITNYDIGVTFTPENEDELKSALIEAIDIYKSGFSYNENALKFQERIDETTFIKKYGQLYSAL